MSRILKVEPHPLGVLVINASNDRERELLVEGEECCGIGFDELKKISMSTHRVEIDDHRAAECRLIKL